MIYFFRIAVFVLILVAGYALFGIGNFKWMYHAVNNPQAEFLISGDKNSDITFVEFVNYSCGHCKNLYPVIEELKQVRKDVRFIIRPIPFQEVTEEKAPYIAIAAGFQGKFEEFNKAFLEYPEEKIPDDFIKETAELYGLNYERLIKDSESEKVEDILTHSMNAMQHAAINSVPSFIIKNKIYIVTNDGIPDLKQLLNIIPTSKN